MNPNQANYVQVVERADFPANFSADARRIINWFWIKRETGSSPLFHKFRNKDWVYIDGCHDFVQYAFPNREPSKFNPDAPLVSDDLLEYIESNPWVKNVIHMYLTQFTFGMKEFLNHYLGDNPPEMDHNYLRITRIIKCLKLFEHRLLNDLNAFATDIVTKLSRTYPESAKMVALFWAEAYND